jgi:hypothetical protein
MTYDLLKLDDYQIMQVFEVARLVKLALLSPALARTGTALRTWPSARI